MRHVKRIAYLLIAVMAIYVCQGTLVPPTAAWAAGGDTFTLAENDPAITSTMRDIQALPTLPPTSINPATGSPYTVAEEFGGLTAARMAGGWGVPAMNALGILSIGGAAIYSAYQLGDFFRAKISGDTGATISSPNVPQWIPYCATGAGENGSNCFRTGSSFSAGSFGGFGTPATGNIGTGSTFAPSTSYYILAIQPGPYLGGFCVTAGVNCTGGNSDNVAVDMATAQSIYSTNPSLTNESFNTTAGTTDCKAIGACVIYWRTFAQMRAATKIDQCNTTCYNAANQKASVAASTATGATANNLQEAKEQCGGFLGASVGSAQQEACRAALNYYVNPSCDTDGSNCVGSSTSGGTTTIVGGGTSGSSFQPFSIPKPQLEEDWNDYLQRLRDKGYLGTVTLDNVTSAGWTTTAAGRGIQDGSVVGVKVGSGTEAYLYDPTTGALNSPEWPENPDQVPTATTPIMITSTPTGTFDPAAPLPGSGSCSCPSLNLDPLKSITVGTSFPFGAFNWFKDSMGSPSATPLTFTLDLPIGSLDVDTSSSWWESNRDTYYPVMEFLITVAFFYVFATRILHMGKADED